MPGPYRLSYEGQYHLLQTENNIPYVYDDKRKKGDPPLARYEDARGYPTIGLGIRIDTEEEREAFRPYLNGRSASEDFIASWNAKIIGQFESDLNRKLGLAELNPNQFDALFSLAWNTGVNSDVVAAVISACKKGDYAAAVDAIEHGPVTSKGEVLPGLVKRRAEEAALFAKPYAGDTTTGWTPPVVPTSTWAWYKDPFIWAHVAVASIFVGVMVRHYRMHRRFKKEARAWQKMKQEHDAGREKDQMYLGDLGHPAMTNPSPCSRSGRKTPTKSGRSVPGTRTRKKIKGS